MKRIALAGLVIGLSLLGGKTAPAGTLAHYWDFSEATVGTNITASGLVFTDKARTGGYLAVADTNVSNESLTSYVDGGTYAAPINGANTENGNTAVAITYNTTNFVGTVTNFATDFNQTAGSVNFTLESMVEFRSAAPAVGTCLSAGTELQVPDIGLRTAAARIFMGLPWAEAEIQARSRLR